MAITCWCAQPCGYPVGGWNEDDYHVLENGVVVGGIFKAPVAPEGALLDVSERPQRRPTPCGAWI
jgi:hypothetical protein